MKAVWVITSVLLAGCANSKYPGWQSVAIVDSVENQPCMMNKLTEKCNDTKEDCDVWFKKRATLGNSNAVVVSGYGNYYTGRYFQCKPGQPKYEKPQFNAAGYGPGLNAVIGQAFLTQRGGGVVTCAGRTVQIYPDHVYFNRRYLDIERGLIPEYEFSNEGQSYIKTSVCDAQGNFEFRNIPSGDWVIKVDVSWEVPKLGYNAWVGYYNTTSKQGGSLKKSVTVKDDEINKFIVTAN
jgi:hypothetical protein